MGQEERARQRLGFEGGRNNGLQPNRRLGLGPLGPRLFEVFSVSQYEGNPEKKRSQPGKGHHTKTPWVASRSISLWSEARGFSCFPPPALQCFERTALWPAGCTGEDGKQIVQMGQRAPRSTPMTTPGKCKIRQGWVQDESPPRS